MNISETAYCDGFSDATGLSLESAAEQISAMNHEFNADNYDEGYSDGESFNDLFNN